MSISEHEDRTNAYPHGPRPVSVDALFREAQNGSSTALGQLMEGCRRYLLLVASRKLDPDLKRKAGASDLVQETFHDAHRDFKNFGGQSVQEFYAWLTGIMNHRMANHVRHYRALMRDVSRESPLDADKRPVDVPAQDLTPCRHAQLRDDSRLVREAVARLPEPLRVVIELRNWQRETFVEIGDRLGISADAAHQRWTNAVNRLKQELRSARQ